MTNATLPTIGQSNLFNMHLLQIGGTHHCIQPYKTSQQPLCTIRIKHGFSGRWSCETQQIQLIDELARGLSLVRRTVLILIDFSKAFDKVSHTKLLCKLHQHGITRITLSWIKAFLLGVALERENRPRSRSHRGAPRSGPWTKLVPFYALMTYLRTLTHKADYLLMTLS